MIKNIANIMIGSLVVALISGITILPGEKAFALSSDFNDSKIDISKVADVQDTENTEKTSKLYSEERKSFKGSYEGETDSKTLNTEARDGFKKNFTETKTNSNKDAGSKDLSKGFKSYSDKGKGEKVWGNHSHTEKDFRAH